MLVPFANFAKYSMYSRRTLAVGYASFYAIARGVITPRDDKKSPPRSMPTVYPAIS